MGKPTEARSLTDRKEVLKGTDYLISTISFGHQVRSVQRYRKYALISIGDTPARGIMKAL